MPEKKSSHRSKGENRSEVLPKDFESQAKKEYDAPKYPDLTFEQFLARETAAFVQRQTGITSPPATYHPGLSPTMTACGNGDFETLLDPTQWQGAFGFAGVGGGWAGHIVFSSLTPGILPGPSPSPNDALDFTTGVTSNFSSQAHQRWVGAGMDWNLLQCNPSVSLPKTAPGSSGAARIGNMVAGAGCELLSKTFVVTPSQALITFWYAIVCGLPDLLSHSGWEMPYFWVRVTNQAGLPVAGAVSLLNGSDRVSPDPFNFNPFFQQTTDWQGSAGLIAYKPWSAAQINLSSMIGQQVTIEFVTADCWHGGHYCYAYIDNLCGDSKGSPEGSLSLNTATSTTCGRGQLCFDYSLPMAVNAQTGAVVTGTVTIVLFIYQNGVLVTSFTSPLLSSGDTYCFAIDPGSIPGLNPALGGFDFAATASFATGTSMPGYNILLSPISVGSPPTGITPGSNNDYQFVCGQSRPEIVNAQNARLTQQKALKVNTLLQVDCQDPAAPPVQTELNGECLFLDIPEITPRIAVEWGDSDCDCIETDDVEVFFVTVSNCYSNVTLADFLVGEIEVTSANGDPVPTLPDGTPSVQIIPSGPICFGDIAPCTAGEQSTVSRQLALWTRGALGGTYRLSLKGVCFSVSNQYQVNQCYQLVLCKD